ncbi:high affinity immunoglobulin gamma Fc receptor I-like [Colossoma macropomum]|uniref:high affinity immunoglobulin gamma Fc receptor I-like n=1 Tax=Colossoma macropomum TaxID=42526 RepID=UPI001863B25E|nr:high affinity immunoglobulin gamma Fc receptor I-like [Colossoma macropomum]
MESHSDWRYQWYKGSSGTAVNQSQTNTFTIRSAADQDQYWCKGQRDNRPSSSQLSNPVTLTVKDGSVILESPVHPVTEGDPLTLRCLYRDPKPSNLTAEFYKDGSLLQTQTTGEMTIPTVSKSDEGLYYCKHPEKGE